MRKITDITNQIKTAYDKNDLIECSQKLIHLMLSYNADIRDNELYNHEFKHLLFNTNCIHNPIGMNYSEKDYNKTRYVLTKLLKILNDINNPKIDTSDLFRKDLIIDDKIIRDIIDISIYTECLYKMNIVNSKRFDDNKICKIPFIEQLLNIIVFLQDQTRILRQNYQSLFEDGYITGMELSITDKDVDHYDELKVSMNDSFSSILESMNEIVHYLYFQYGNDLETCITSIKTEIIQPYKNAEFELYINIALQRAILCRLEEGIRYGYYSLENMGKTKEGINAYTFILENDEKYKARTIGILRREYQIRKQAMSYDNSRTKKAKENIKILANLLIDVQAKEQELLDFSKFHPDKELIKSAEECMKVKTSVVENLIKGTYLDCDVKGVKIKDLLIVYNYLNTISEILYSASLSIIDLKKPSTYVKEICIIDISYLINEISRIHDFKVDYAKKLINKYIFHEKRNRDEDIFAQPLLKISKTQIVLSQALLDQVNLDRFIERQFICNKVDIAKVGHAFEKKFIDVLKKGYRENSIDSEYKKIPNFSVNTNKINYIAFDGKEIEFDVVAVLGNHLILTELKALMTSYDLSDLEKRKKSIKEAKNQLKRRAESVKYDWEKIKNKASIELPEQPFDQDHIVLIACTDAYDYTPLKYENVFITDDSSYLKYFTNPYIEVIKESAYGVEIKKIKNIWRTGKPDALEFMEYLINPVTTQFFSDSVKKQFVPVPIIDEKDYIIAREEYILSQDPVKVMAMNNSEKVVNHK